MVTDHFIDSADPMIGLNFKIRARLAGRDQGLRADRQSICARISQPTDNLARRQH
jgi:hypothetical protein